MSALPAARSLRVAIKSIFSSSYCMHFIYNPPEQKSPCVGRSLRAPLPQLGTVSPLLLLLQRQSTGSEIRVCLFQKPRGRGWREGVSLSLPSSSRVVLC